MVLGSRFSFFLLRPWTILPLFHHYLVEDVPKTVDGFKWSDFVSWKSTSESNMHNLALYRRFERLMSIIVRRGIYIGFTFLSDLDPLPQGESGWPM